MSENVTRRADLTSLGGIAQAREDLYNQLAAGTIPEARANIMERVLRGQVTLKGELPIRYVKMLSGSKGNAVLEGYAQEVLGNIASFLRPALPAAQPEAAE